MDASPIEIVSPLAYRDIDRICRVSRIPGLVATCARCNETVYRNIHLPMVAHGMYCERHCPCRHFVPTPDEVAAMERNRRNGDAGEDVPVQKPVKPVVSPEERRARMSQKLADAARARWADPAQRAKMLKGMEGRKPTPKPKLAPCLVAAGLSPHYNGPWK